MFLGLALLNWPLNEGFTHFQIDMVVTMYRPNKTFIEQQT